MANRHGQPIRLSRIQIFLTASLSLHLILFGAGYLLLPEWKIETFIPPRLELILLPSSPSPVTEEKPTVKAVRLEPKAPVPKEAEKPLPEPARESISVPKEIEKVPDPPRIVAKENPKEEPRPVPGQDEAEKIVQAPPAAETAVAFSKEEKPSLQTEGNSKKEENPFPVRIASSMAENLAIPVHPSYGSKGPGSSRLGSASPPAPQALVKLPSPPAGEITVARPRYDENPKPAYPREARKKGWEGEVLLRVEVLVNGRVGQVEIKSSSGYDLLDQSALSTVKQWKFVPARKGAEPIPLWVNIPVKYRLQ